MKANYISPNIDIIEVDVTDIIAYSINGEGMKNLDETQNPFAPGGSSGGGTESRTSSTDLFDDVW